MRICTRSISTKLKDLRKVIRGIKNNSRILKIQRMKIRNQSITYPLHIYLIIITGPLKSIRSVHIQSHQKVRMHLVSISKTVFIRRCLMTSTNKTEHLKKQARACITNHSLIKKRRTNPSHAAAVEGPSTMDRTE